MNPVNCHSSDVNLSEKDNIKFVQLEPVYIDTDIIKPNLVGDYYVRILTALYFPSNTGYHRFDYLL